MVEVMKQWRIKYKLIDNPTLIQEWPKLEAYDHGDASFQFYKMMVHKFGFAKEDYGIVHITEIK